MTLANLPGASVTQAAEKLKGILAEPSEPTVPTDARPEQPIAQQDSDSNEPETHTEQAQSDTEAPSRRRKAKLGDREIEFEVLSDDVDLDLIPKGLMMENDYRQKTMSLADERKAFEANKSEFDKALAELQDSVMMSAEALDSDEMKELKEIDPDQYWKRFEEVRGQAERLKSYKEKRDTEILEQQKALAESEVAKYSQVIPEWLDDSVKAKDTEKMVNLLAKSGFSNDEIGSIYDSRIMSIVRKAALFDEISSAKLDSKRVQAPPKSARPSANTPAREKTRAQQSMDRLRKTGKLNDAQAAIKNLILGG